MPEKRMHIAVSVVMPLWNGARYVERAVRSVLGQTYGNFELLVVDDGSTDNGPDLVKAIDDTRIRLLHQEQRGVSAARNKGIRESSNTLVAFCDSDDEWMPHFLETIVNLHQKFDSCSVFATHYCYREQNGTVRLPVLRGIPGGLWEGELENYFSVAVKSDPPLWSSAVAVKKSNLLDIGGFPEDIKIGEDLLTWSRLALRGRIAYSSRPGAYFILRGPLAGTPTRVPEIPDKVGEELHRMLELVSGPQFKSLKHYIAYWHRMRAAMFLHLHNRQQTIHECRAITRYSLFNLQLFMYLLLALLPFQVQRGLLQGLSWMKIRKRVKL